MLTHIVHSAASTCFTLPLAAAREINVTGTAHVMKLAKRCLSQGRLKGVAHVSTAYVNGPSPHSICESTLDHREEFSNTYDRTKWEAERYVQSLQGELPLHVFRPSIVVGDSQTGHTSSFNVLYAPLRLIASEWVRTLPGYPQSLLDVVPSDYVTRAMDYILLQRPSIPGQTYHLVAGYSGSMTVSEVVAEATRVFGTRRARPPIRYLASGRMEQVLPGAGGNNVRVHEVLRVFAPFMTAHWSFDFAHTREALIGSGISCPPFDQYIQTCLEFCKRTNWGKHAILQTAGEIRVSDRGHRQPELPRRLAWELAPAS